MTAKSVLMRSKACGPGRVPQLPSSLCYATVRRYQRYE